MNCQEEGKDCGECTIRNLRQSHHFLTFPADINVLSPSRVMRRKSVMVSEGCCLINISEIIVTAYYRRKKKFGQVYH